MINPSLQSQNISPFCSTNYNKSATIQRHHPHHHQSRAATRRRIRTSAVGARSRSLAKHEHQRSFQYTRTLGVILEEQQHDSATSQHCGDNTNNNAVITTDFWHSMRGMKKSATSVSLESLVASEEEIRNNEENQSPNHAHNGPVSIEFDQDENDFDNFLEDWDL